MRSVVFALLACASAVPALGVGPNLTPAGPGLAIAAGVTFGMGPLKVPVNVAIVPSRSGTRISVLTGFNTRRN